MKNIKLIATDMDNTLLNPEGKLPSDFFNYLDQLLDLKIEFVVASGRPMFKIREFMGEYTNKISIVGDNGASLERHGEVLDLRKFNRAELIEIIEFFNKQATGIPVLFGIESAYLDERFKKYFNDMSWYFSPIKLKKNLKEFDEDIIKLSIYYPDNNAREFFYRNVQAHFSKHYEIVLGHSVWIDLTLKGVNKGRALKELADSLSIKFDEMMAFGDAMNDKEMLESVKYSYIVENAQDELKEFAQFITESNEKNGVLKVLNEVIYSKNKK